MPAEGSSPHTRGAHDPNRSFGEKMGIIPAYAGSTDIHGGHARRGRDHPRIRGEHGDYNGDMRKLDGSSPHTRGAPAVWPVHRRRPGIIPAYAGSTARTRSPLWIDRDHPRIRGEHAGLDGPAEWAEGSSPHTRGARTQPAGARQADRIIPAYAGSTRLVGQARAAGWDHPRIRGEHRCLRLDNPSHLGSSPHTRGARPGPGRGRGRGRIIPAYAGSTYPGSRPCGRRPDHPRIRGEHARSRPPRPDLTGSSPHTRGALHPTRRHRPRPRIIPAYAGSTPGPAPAYGA